MNIFVAFFVNRLFFLNAAEKLRLVKALNCHLDCQELTKENLQKIIARRVKAQFDSKMIMNEVERDLKILEKKNIQFVGIWQKKYPYALKQIYNPPFILYYRGIFPQSWDNALSVVGTRIATKKALEQGFEVTSQLAEYGIPIISGLALGIDAMAHKACVKNGKPTYAILGNAIDCIYPKTNSHLALDILNNQGAIISEYPPNFPTKRYNFPQRNRIVSGLSRGTLLVEAPLKSGAMITIKLALDEGKDVFVLEKETENSRNEGGEYWLSQGAIGIKTANDLLNSWELPLIMTKEKTFIPEFSQIQDELVYQLKKEMHLE